MQYFSTCLLDENGKTKTHEVDGSKNIVVNADKQTYTHDEILNAIECAFSIERLQYGWRVKFNDGRQPKEVFIRGNDDKCNDTTSSKQAIHGWIDHLYGKGIMQISLF